MKGLRILALLAFCGVVFTQSPQPTSARVRPAGRVERIGGFPMSTVLSPDGRFLLVLDAADEGAIQVFDAAGERSIGKAAAPGAWLGIAFSPNGRLVYASGGATGAVHEFRFSPEGQLELLRSMPAIAERDRTPQDLIGDIALTPDGRLIFAADILHDRILVINPQSGRVIERYPVGRRPYRIFFAPGGSSFYVSRWADGMVGQYDAVNGRSLGTVFLGAHPTDIAWRDKKTQLEEGEEAPWDARMFVPAAHTNSVYSLAISSGAQARVVERIDVGLFVNQPLGMTPSAVALSPEQDRLYIACSDANAIAVVNVAGVKSNLVGFIPTAEYPTALRMLPDGRIVVVSGGGSVAFLTPPAENQLRSLTAIVFDTTPLKERDPRERPIAYSPLPFSRGEQTPIDHVVYILKNGRPFSEAGAQGAPNQFKLAREFTSIPSFAPAGSNAREGYYWASAAIVPDFARKVDAAIRNGRPEINETTEFAAQPPAGFLWNQTSAYAYGLGTGRLRPTAAMSAAAFAPPDSKILDVDRAQAFLKDFQRFDEQQSLPSLVILHLANDGAGTPEMVADNDYALGLIIERLTHSKYWPRLAIVVAGIDGGKDDRASAFLISPYAKRGFAYPGAAGTLSLLRTIELLLNLAPMTMHDAGALPIEAAFQATPDLRPYDVERPRLVR